jgi:hypothetical protein
LVRPLDISSIKLIKAVLRLMGMAGAFTPCLDHWPAQGFRSSPSAMASIGW